MSSVLTVKNVFQEEVGKPTSNDISSSGKHTFQ